jgi:hypothetical protein
MMDLYILFGFSPFHGITFFKGIPQGIKFLVEVSMWYHGYIFSTSSMLHDTAGDNRRRGAW